MKKNSTHSTNYINTLIEISDDCPAEKGTQPTSKREQKTIAELQFERLVNQPYRFTSDDVLFGVFAEKNELTESELSQARESFFSKGQPCFRASPLTKQYGFGVHANHEGKIALVPVESEQYAALQQDASVIKVKAMRNSKK
ncbi:hypothetical protein EP331_01370 [bacterium]|nr:MAG: hypothetical protein EP331_01370 [bacterium]